jgi:hypothetical protein
MGMGIGTDSGTIWAITGCLIVAASMIRWLTRCKHPNPHYIRPATTPPSGAPTVVGAGRYECYECGRTWTAKTDPAWAPTRLMQKFVGYDEQKIHQAATRAAIEAEQRRILAAHRVARSTPPATAKPASPRRRNRPSNIIDLNSRRPA